MLLTGARGFTGVYVRNELERAGYEVIGTLARGETAGAHEHLLDISSLHDCRRVIGEVRPTHLVHLADQFRGA